MFLDGDAFIEAFETGALPNSAFHHRFWAHLVQHLAEALPSVDRFETLLALYPQLADKTLVYHRYRPETLASSAARAGWTLPDLLPLPQAQSVSRWPRADQPVSRHHPPRRRGNLRRHQAAYPPHASR